MFSTKNYERSTICLHLIQRWAFLWLAYNLFCWWSVHEPWYKKSLTIRTGIRNIFKTSDKLYRTAQNVQYPCMSLRSARSTTEFFSYLGSAWAQSDSNWLKKIQFQCRASFVPGPGLSTAWVQPEPNPNPNGFKKNSNFNAGVSTKWNTLDVTVHWIRSPNIRATYLLS